VGFASPVESVIGVCLAFCFELFCRFLPITSAASVSSLIHRQPFIPRIYFGYSKDESLKLTFTNLGVECIFLDDYQEPENHADKLLFLKSKLAKDGVTALVWVTLPIFMPFAFSIRVSPVQIWWAMKYHNLPFDDIDGRFCDGSYEQAKTVAGKSWRVVHSALTNLFDDTKTEQAQTLRDSFAQFEFLLGCIGREEKMDCPAYLETIANILKARPKAAFLWTGRDFLPSVQETFARLGVADRCFFIGWVDTRLYAQVIDIYLDSFSFGGGHTVFQSMMADKPVVMYSSQETLESGVPMHIWPVLNGDAGTVLQQQVQDIFYQNNENLFLFANTPEEYRSYALRLIDDELFRQNVAQAGKIFVCQHMSDTQRMAQSFYQQLIQTINEVKALTFEILS